MAQGIFGTVYRLSLRVYDPHVGATERLSLGRHVGFPSGAGAPLWTRRLPPNRLLRFPQPRAFMTRLVAGTADIQLHVS